MDLTVIQNLIASLLLNAASISGYPVPTAPPEVHLVPAAQIQHRVCDKPCRVRAFFAPGEGIFLDSSLDLKGDFYDRSILVHELVHFSGHSKRLDRSFTGRFTTEARSREELCAELGAAWS